MRLIIAPEPAHSESKVATTGIEIGFHLHSLSLERIMSSVPGGTISRRKPAKTFTTDCAFTCTKTEVKAVSTGNSESRNEYAAPLAIPKQLSSHAAKTALLRRLAV